MFLVETVSVDIIIRKCLLLFSNNEEFLAAG